MYMLTTDMNTFNSSYSLRNKNFLHFLLWLRRFVKRAASNFFTISRSFIFPESRNLSDYEKYNISFIPCCSFDVSSVNSLLETIGNAKNHYDVLYNTLQAS